MSWLVYIFFSLFFIGTIGSQIGALGDIFIQNFSKEYVLFPIGLFIFLQIIFGYGLAKIQNWARRGVLLEANIVLIDLLALVLYDSKFGASKDVDEFLTRIIGCVICGLILIIHLNRSKVANNFLENKRKRRELNKNKEVVNYILANAHIGLGDVFRLKGDTTLAVTHYETAKKLGFALPEPAIRLMAKYYAEKRIKTEEAIEFYLDYIRLDSIYDKMVISLLKQLCYLDETTDLNKRKKIKDLNKKVLKANPRIKWAHFYLALAYLFDGYPNIAAKGLKKSLSLEPDNLLAYYWLVKCLLNIKDEDQAEIFAYGHKFLDFKVEDKNTKAKQAEISYIFGNLIFKEFENSSEWEELSQGAKQKVNSAIYYFEISIKRYPDEAKYHYNLGRAFSLINNSSQAVKEFSKTCEIDKNNAEYYYYLGRELFKIGDFSNAKENLKKAIRVDSKYVYTHQAYEILITIFISEKNYEEAEIYCRKERKLFGNTPQFYAALIASLYYQGKYGEVIKQYLTAPVTVASLPPMSEIEEGILKGLFWKQLVSLSTLYLNIDYFIARSYSILNLPEKAVKFYENLVLLDGSRRIKNHDDNYPYYKGPMSVEDKGLKYNYYFGCTLANKGDYNGALTEFNKVLQSEDSKKARAYLQIGHIYTKMGKEKEAEDNYLKAYKQDGKDKDIIYYLGNYYLTTNKLDKALSYFNEALNLNSSHNPSHIAKGIIAERQGNISTAIAEYSSVQNENYADFLNKRLGILHYKNQNYKKSIEYLKKTKKDDAVLFYLGLSLISSGHYDEALDSWCILAKRYPKDMELERNIAKAHYLKGCHLVEKEDYQGAIREWEKYLEESGEDDEVKKSVAMLNYIAGDSALKGKKDDNLKTAKEFFQRALELDSNNRFYLYKYALLNLYLNNFNEALNFLEKLSGSEPDKSNLKYYKGLALLKKGEKDKALPFFNEIINSNKKDIYTDYARWVVANEHIKEGQYSEAIEILYTISELAK